MLALRLAGAAILVAVLAAYAREKRASGAWGEMLFGCHVASATTALGLVTASRWLVGAALAFSVGVGLPSWLFEVLAKARTRPLEVLAHLAPIAAAAPFAVENGVPRGAGLAAWAAFMALTAASRVATAPALNVNLAHRPSPELARLVPHRGAARALLVSSSLAMLLATEWVLRHV